MKMDLSSINGFTPDTIAALLGDKMNSNDFKEYFSSIDYVSLSSPGNFPVVKKLFAVLGINLKAFNELASYPIDFQPYFIQLFDKVKSQYRIRYENFLFDQLKDKDVKEKRGYYRKKCRYNEVLLTERVDNLEFDAVDRFRTEVETRLGLTMSQLQNAGARDLLLQYNENKNRLSEKIEKEGSFNASDMRRFQDNEENKSLIFFGEFDELCREYFLAYGQAESPDHKKLTLNGDDVSYRDDDASELFKQVDEEVIASDYKLNDTEPGKPEERDRNPGNEERGGTNGKRRGSRFDAKSRQETGLLGEMYAYSLLCKEYKGRVNWISGNGELAGKNDGGDDEQGYDMTYEDDNGVKYYVEVKASTGDASEFYITSSEIAAGERYKERFEIIFITNVKEKQRGFTRLKGLFCLPAGETFMVNSKFSVENNDFRIRFQSVTV
jgi:hypothetical protein